MKSKLIRRIAAGVGANTYAQISTIGIQLLSLPLFLHQWDLDRYGQWLVISALPAYIAMADVGMVTATANRMMMLSGEHEKAAANRVFQSTLVFMAVVCGTIAVLGLLVLAALPGRFLPSESSRWAIAALSASVIFSLFGGLPEAIYKATERYALGTALANTVRVLEWGGGIAGLWLSGSFVAVAVGALLPRAVFTLAMMIHTARTAPQFEWGFAHATMSEVKRSAGPAVSFMAFPAANAIAFQGMTLVVAATLGPAATAMYNTYRTMARVTVQATATFGNALWPEFARLFGAGQRDALRSVYRRSYGLGVVLAAIAGVIVFFVAQPVLRAWSAGRIAFDAELMSISMAYAAVAGCWHVSRVLLLATNRHGHLAWQYLVVSAASLPLGSLLARSHGLVGVMAVMLVAEVVMLTVCTRSSRLLLQAPRPASASAAAREAAEA